MSRRQRSEKEQARRARAAREKVLRRRARTRRAAKIAASVVTLVVAGTAGSVAPVAGADAGSATAAATGGEHPDCTTPDSNPVDLTDVDGRLFFTATDEVRGLALWRSDVSGSTAVRLLDFPYNYGSDGRYDDFGYRGLIDVGGTLFFTTKTDRTDALWRTDGTRGGTVRIKKFSDLDSRGHESGPTNMTAVGDTLFFTANGSNGELWKSDGTTASTVLVKAIPSPGYDEYYHHGPSNLTTVGDRLFFTADDGTGNEELWTSDGSSNGTVLVKDIYPGSDEHDGPDRLTALGDTVYFTADDGVHGRELWKSDGTAAGTAMVEDVEPGAVSGDPVRLTAFGDSLYFASRDDADGSRDLWVSDGTAAGTSVVKEFGATEEGLGFIGPIVVVGDRMFFAAYDTAADLELWTSDGTEAGTVLVKDLHPGPDDQGPGNLTAVGDTLFFTTFERWAPGGGADLWRSDGTEAGTAVVAHIDSAPYGWPDRLTASGGKLFFETDDGVHGQELWVSDGSESGTHLVRDINWIGMGVASSAKTGPRNGAARVSATFYSGGTFSVAPAGKGGVRRFHTEVDWPGNWYWTGDTFTLELTRAAKRKLRRTGQVDIGAEFTFTSCAGPVTSVTRSYTLKER